MKLGTRSISWSFAWPWLLGFVLTVYLGLNGGGFDPIVSDQVGIAIWWLVLLAVAVGAVPGGRQGPLALTALGLFAALALWTALSLRWTESTEKTAADVALVTTYLGVFALALLARRRGTANHYVAAVASGIFVVTAVALLARLHPAWFPDAAETGRFLESGRERLSYPLDYWNGLAALISIGLPLLLHLASEARHAALRGLAAAALPAMVLALFLTLSRAGIAAGAIAVAVYLLLAHDRLPKALNLAIAAAGGGLLILLASRRDALTEGLATETAHSQGDSLLLLTILVCLGVGAIVAALALRRGERPGWTRISRNGSLAVVGVVIAAALVAFFAANGPHRLSNAWDEFKQPATGSYQGTSRLGEVGGENRYQLWASALREFEDDPFHGTGANTFQFWWTRDTDVGTAILDTHQLYLQVLGELGIVGFLLLLAFVLLTLGWGGVQALRAGPRARSWLAAAVAGSTVLWVTSLVDWTWKLPIIPVATLLLIAVTITAGDGGEGKRSPSPLAIPWRLGVALVSLLAILAIAIPLTGTSLVRDSQEEARAGDPEAALADARSAQNVQPGAATPRMQEALILESQGEIEAAAEAARAATEREPTNWRTWLLRSRIEAQRGRPRAALAAYRTAKSLNPLSSVFIRTG